MRFLIAFILMVASFTANAECVRLLTDTQAKTQPDKQWVTFKKDDVFKIIKKSPNGKLVFAVRGQQKAVFSMSAVVEELCLHSENAKPDEAPPEVPIEKPTAPIAKQETSNTPSFLQQVRWGAEYQMHMNTSSANYSGLITTIPDPSDVSQLQDPIIADVKRGTGSMLRLTAEFRYSDKIDLDANIGLRKLTYKYLQKSNPGLTPVALSSLQSSEKSFDVSHYGIGFGGKYFFTDLPEQNLRFFTGAQVQILYSVSTEIVINALVGSFFKNTPTTVTTKIEQISSDGLLHAGVQWKRINFSLGVTPYMAYVIGLGGSFSF